MSIGRRHSLMAEIVTLRDEFQEFIDEEKDKLDGELWDALEVDVKFLNYELHLLTNDYLNDRGIENASQNFEDSQKFLADTKHDHELWKNES